MQYFPVIEYPHYTEEVTLDGLLYTFQFDWNSRGQYWSISMSDRNGNLLIAGVKVLLDIPIFGRYKRSTLPPGTLIPLRTNSSKDPIAEGEMGETVRIIYVTGAEIASF